MTLSLRKLAKKALGITSWNSDEHQSRLITDPKTIFDVGANVGQSAKTYRRLYPNADIWSFEPFPATYKTLCRSLSDERFHPTQLALSDRISKTELNIGAQSITNSLLRRETDTGETIEVQTDTIDHFCWANGISNIDILKVDVEGAERLLHVVHGLAGVAEEILEAGRQHEAVREHRALHVPGCRSRTPPG